MPPTKADQSKLGNRDRILQTSIALFAQKGYGNVTTREIAAQVGIKAASIYNHFPSKEAILDEIVACLCDGLHTWVHPAFDTAQALDARGFLARVQTANEAFFSDPQHANIGLIVMREQFQNERVRAILLVEMIETPRRMIAAYFERLMQAGQMRVADPAFAAREYHAFFVYEFYETALAFGLHPPAADILAQREAHVAQFLQAWAL